MRPAAIVLRDHRGVADSPAAPATAARPGSLFEAGRNCCTIARAHRAGLVVDGEAYFRTFARAAERAERSIAILAWDFNSNTRLRFDGEGEAPERLGDFLNWLVRRRRSLRVYILDWDYPMVFGTDREFPPLYGFGWHPHRRVHLTYDDTHPVTASHHQKIVVIDDALAFIGGFDLTVRRWDTCKHSPDEIRRDCDGKPYPPFHDMMMVVDGDAALALGRVARARWLAATGHPLPAAPRKPPDLWPEGLPVRFRDVDIAIARTLPPRDDAPAVAEVEALYYDMISAARRRIYIENQYFTAGGLGEALAERLRADDGPEVVVVVRLFSHGWLEEHTMNALRTKLVQRLRAADRHGRFHIYYPHVDGLGEKICIDLHSKLMIVDDEILRVGSANWCNRSMGLDSECDAALEARGDARVARAIADFRSELLAEHLDRSPEEVDAAVRRHGTLAGAIEELGGQCRTLRRLEEPETLPAPLLDFASVGDPAQPVSLERIAEEFSPEAVFRDDSAPAAPGGPQDITAPGPANPPLRRAAMRIVGVVLVLIALAAVWKYTPLSQWGDPDRISALAREFAHRPWAPLVILLAYTPACVLMFPRPLITLAAVVAFGPYMGFGFALGGILIAAFFTYVAGLGLPEETVSNLAGRKLRHIAETLRRRGLIAVTALRLVPIAPFAVEGVVAAAIGIRLAPFMAGTAIGMLPGTLATTVFGNQLQEALRDPGRVNYGLVAAAIAGVALLTLAVRRWLVADHRHHHGNGNQRPR
ncbi:conserved hypothetical membrane protein [Azoarcus olearius]|uniref:Conserved hypothetical membrane protein n=1 Tax=Azoarcus sp. (strain BH72) TaxID=418699 RepID=A1K6E5_AZOSB|nr:conserved hypothetical membrane protein [Azoarcus olearius]